MAIVAVGQVASVETAAGLPEHNLVENGCFYVDKYSLSTRAQGIFAGGDCITGGGSVIQAIADGQRAAIAIDRMLGGKGQLLPDTGFSFRKPTDDEICEQARVARPEVPPEQRRRSFVEVLCGLEPDQACSEALRCLRCDLEERGG
jgi:NADPH-dependent glutamate synthase beta subunit-like oxidoreductase